MLRRILLALDGHGVASGPADLAVDWAQRYSALLVGLGVIDREALAPPESIPVGAGAFKAEQDRSRLRRTRGEVDQLLESFSLRCARENVACKLLEDVGHPEEQIVLEAQRFDLVVVGRHLRFQFPRQHDEYLALRSVLKNASRPVVSVPDAYHAGNHVVIAYDGSAQAARSLYTFLAAGLHHFHDLHVVSIGPTKLEAAPRGDRAVEFIMSHGLEATLHTFLDCHPIDRTLIEEAQRLDAGLLVMGAYGHGPFREAFIGSTTRALLRDCKVPLFLYH